jgi:hypothetical protein
MSRFLSTSVLLFGALVATLTLSGSANVTLWAACLLTVPALIFLAGGARAHPVLLWILGLNWFCIVADVIAADLEGVTITDSFGSYAERAILYSLCAMTAMAAGIGSGKVIYQFASANVVRVRKTAAAPISSPFVLDRLITAYFVSAVIVSLLGTVAGIIPGLTQPILALALLKYVCIYLLAITIIETQSGYKWLGLVAVIEIAVGMIGFFSSYKESIFVILIAFVSARQKPSARQMIFAVTAVLLVFYISVVWTVIKGDYRSKMNDMTLEQKISYMVSAYTGDIDYQAGIVGLFKRIGYTTLYSQVLAREDAGAIAPDHNFYGKAILHVLTPRLLFPDKEALDDSAITTELLGIRITEDTSIGIGYVAEAEVDYGFPDLMVPLAAIGLLLGLAAQYFMTRPVPLHVRQAFTVATLFNCFLFAANIDKEFGGFVTGVLAMAIVIKFGYPRIEPWLAGASIRRKVYAVRTGR